MPMSLAVKPKDGVKIPSPPKVGIPTPPIVIMPAPPNLVNEAVNEARALSPWQYMAQYYRPGVGNVVVSHPAGLQDVYNWLVHYYASTGQVPSWANRPWVLSVLPAWVFAMNAGQPLPWQVSPAANQQMSPAMAQAANKLASLVAPSQQAQQQLQQHAQQLLNNQQSTQNTSIQNTSTTISVIPNPTQHETHNTGGQPHPHGISYPTPTQHGEPTYPPPPTKTTTQSTSKIPSWEELRSLEALRGGQIFTTNATNSTGGQTTTNAESRSSTPLQPTPLGERRLHSPVVF